MKLPKYHHTYTQILKTLENGETLHKRDLIIRVRDKYYSKLSDNLRSEVTRTGSNKLNDRIGWGISYLKIAKFLHYPSRGMRQITEKGKSALPKGVTYKDVLDDPDYLAHVANREERKQNKEENPEDLNLKEASPQDLIDTGLSAIEGQIKGELLEKLKGTDPYYFERVILKLLKKMGYGDFIETPKSGDGGIDGVINSDELGLEKIYIQAKRYTETNVSEKEIRNFIGAMSGDTSKGIFATTSRFNDSALEKARQAHHSIILIDGDKLVNLMHQHNVGVQVHETYEIKEIDEDFFI